MLVYETSLISGVNGEFHGVTFLVLNEKYWKSQQCHQSSWIDSCWDALGGVSESGFFYDVSQHYGTELDKWKIYHLNKHLYQTLFTKISQASENGWHYLFQFRKKENKTKKNRIHNRFTAKKHFGRTLSASKMRMNKIRWSLTRASAYYLPSDSRSPGFLGRVSISFEEMSPWKFLCSR